MENKELAPVTLTPPDASDSPPLSVASMTPSPECVRHSPKAIISSGKRHVSYSIDSILGVRNPQSASPSSPDASLESSTNSGNHCSRCFFYFYNFRLFIINISMIVTTLPY